MAQLNTLNESALNSLVRQSCVKAVFEAKLPSELKKEAEAFIKRNTLPDCNKVPPNCLKAHLIRTANKLKLSNNYLDKIKNLFRAKVGFKGYYLDAGKLRRV